MAPLALDAAHAFADIAPVVSHARHMPTHIFIQHGMWDLVSGHNQAAYDVAVELWEPGDALGDAVHALDWGQYGDLQRGDYAKARLWMERLSEMVEHEGFEAGGARGAAGTARRKVRCRSSRRATSSRPRSGRFSRSRTTHAPANCSRPASAPRARVTWRPWRRPRKPLPTSPTERATTTSCTCRRAHSTTPRGVTPARPSR